MISDVAVPHSTRFTRLGFLARLQTGLTIDAARATDFSSVRWPYLRVANVQAGWIDLSEVAEVSVPLALAARSTLRLGDVLMTEGGDLDKLGRGTVWEGQLANCLHQNHVFAVRPFRQLLDPHFLALLSRTSHARRYFESTGVKTTNLASTNSSKILSLPVPLIPVGDQRGIVQMCSVATGQSDALRRLLVSQTSMLLERRQALITAAVTGELSIPGVAA